MPEIGQGFLPKPLQKPHPPIVVTAVAPFSKGVTEAAARGWDPISANFLMPEWVKSHWPKYVEGCERAGRKADPANWRVAKSIFVADDDKTAKAYVDRSEQPVSLLLQPALHQAEEGPARTVQDAARPARQRSDARRHLRRADHPRLAGQGRRRDPEIPRAGRRLRHAALCRQGLARSEAGQALDDAAGREGDAQGQRGDQEGGEERREPAARFRHPADRRERAGAAARGGRRRGQSGFQPACCRRTS